MAPPSNDLILSSEMFKRSKNLATYIVNKELGINQRWDKTGEKLHELCKDMSFKHESLFESICDRINFNEDNIDDYSKTIMKEVFNGGCNFGRIVSLYTFCLTLSDFCYKNNLADQIDVICKNTALALYSYMNWFENHGSWDGFINYFVKPEEKLWKGLAITTVGLGAMAGLLYANS